MPVPREEKKMISQSPFKMDILSTQICVGTHQHQTTEAPKYKVRLQVNCLPNHINYEVQLRGHINQAQVKQQTIQARL